ncbi:MAG: ABC transporter ATP-binding protein, partial [Planctomycetales bacterium]|nr:ABC transporter ATP-binding protein [Planctomycetales bacterium]
MSADNSVVVIKQLTKRYGTFTALDDLSLTIQAGQILGMIGPNGAGKTTCIKILVGLARPSSGTASIGGADCVRDARRIKHLVGYMPDKFGSYDNMRVHEYLDFFGATFGLSRPVRKQRMEEVMDTTGTTYMRDKFVETLSHGMQQRVGIARTLLHNPQVLILDEPANGLDPQARIEMRDLLIRLARSGKTLIVTSHILPELSRICDQVAILTHGKLRALGTVDQISHMVSQERTIEAQLSNREQLAAGCSIAKSHLEPTVEVVQVPAEGVLRFRTALPEAQLADLLSALIQGGVKVSQFREVQTDLEEAFMSFARPNDGENPRSGKSIETVVEGS